MALNQLDEAKKVYDGADARKLRSEALTLNEYMLAFLRNDEVGMQKVLSTVAGTPYSADELLGVQGDLQAWHGRFKNANDLTRRAVTLAKGKEANEGAAAYLVMAALRQVEVGQKKLAIDSAHEALRLGANRDVKVISAVALALVGDTAGAEDCCRCRQRLPFGHVGTGILTAIDSCGNRALSPRSGQSP